MVTPGAGHIQKKNLLENPYPVLPMVEVHVSDTQAIRVVRNTDRVEYPDASGIYYYPRLLSIGLVQQRTGGVPAPIRVRTANMDRKMFELVEDHGGLMRKPAVVRFVSYDDRGETGYDELELVVRGHDGDFEFATWYLAPPDQRSRETPRLVYGPRCIWPFKQQNTCGYVGDIPDCPRDVRSCIARGNDMVINGRPRIHPGVFGGQPGLSERA